MTTTERTMLDWKLIDDDARDGREVLLRRADGAVNAGYYGLAMLAHGAGASTSYPWTILDNTNGVNHLRDGGEFGATHYADIATLRASAQSPAANNTPIPLADHDEIGRKVLNQPWQIQSPIVTITAHCTSLTDEHPTGIVADLAGAISKNCLALADALATPPAQQPACREALEVSEEMLEAGAQALADDVWHPPQLLKSLSGSDVNRFKRQALLVLKAALALLPKAQDATLSRPERGGAEK